MIYEKTGRLSRPVFCAFDPYIERQTMLKMVDRCNDTPRLWRKDTRGNYMFSIKKIGDSIIFLWILFK